MVVHRRETGLDKLGIEHDGVYCIFPFSELDNIRHRVLYLIYLNPFLYDELPYIISS